MDISRRLHDALIADSVEDAGDDEAWIDQLLRWSAKDPRDVTEHLARQLGFSAFAMTDDAVDLHETLFPLVTELDDILKRRWPLPPESKAASELAQLACRHLGGLATYATFRHGPERWKRERIGATTVGALDLALQPLLLRCFTTSLNELLARWQRWDVLGLRERWKRERTERDEAAWEARKTERAGSSPQERARKRAERLKLSGGYNFTPTYRGDRS